MIPKLSKRTIRRFDQIKKNRCFWLLTLFLVIYICNIYAMTYTYGKSLLKKKVETTLMLPNVVVHLDLKGVPPNLSYLKTLLPMMKRHGVTGLLMEYEDMFPYEDKLANLSARNSYGKKELRTFLTLASSEGFEIIPLVQTFGHMEFALKLPEFKHLREQALYPDSICPSSSRSLELIRNMIEQVIKFHNNITRLKHIHVGCDEVLLMNKCERCYNRNQDDIEIFMNHLEVIGAIVENISSETTVLIWDDMLRSVKPDKWNQIRYLGKVVPVYWDYKPNLSLAHSALLQYHKAFKDIWVASAFKGADGSVATIPNLQDRFLNHFKWLTSIIGYKFGGERETYIFKGMILTGWSRYSHMDPLCELLPVSIPSLVLNLIAVDSFKKGVYDKDKWTDGDWIDFYVEKLEPDLTNELNCNGPIKLEHFTKLNCYFDGAKLYNKLIEFKKKNEDVIAAFTNEREGLFWKLYHAKLGKYNMIKLAEDTEWCKNTLKDITQLENELKKLMARYYDDHVIEEYVEFETYYAKSIIRRFLLDIKGFLKVRTWKRGPVDTIIHYLVINDSRKSVNV